jgi:single-strand DNA-binding protein
MNETHMTLIGNVVEDPRRRETKNGHAVTNFRVASTSRRYDREQDRFVDSGTLYVTVTCWRGLAENVDKSIRKGQPVVVNGRYYMREYTVDEQVRTAYELEAIAVGHDLSRGTTDFTRVYQNATPSVSVSRDEHGVPTDDSDHWLGLSEPSGEDGELDDVSAERELVAAAS